MFLDLTAGPFGLRAAELGWAPDAYDRYCPRCGRGVGVGEVPKLPGAGCRECDGVNFAWDRIVRLGAYADPLRRWVHEIKFTRWRRLGEDLGELLGTALLASYERDGEGSRVPVLVAVPDGPVRRIWRGIDHAAVIARAASRVTGWEVVRPLYRRPGRSQLAVPPSERGSNAAKSYGLCKGEWREQLASRTVIVVDDVVTTGATMRACCRLIASAWPRGDKHRRPRIWAACLGRAEVDGHNRKRGV